MGASSSNTNSVLSKEDSKSEHAYSSTTSSISKKNNKIIAAFHTSSSILKSSFKRKASSRDQTKPFRELIRTWPLQDVESLRKEFDADLYLFELQSLCDSARKPTNSFEIDFEKAKETTSDFEIHVEKEFYKVHKSFISIRCKKLSFDSDEEVSRFSNQFESHQFSEFLKYVYTENCSLSPEVLDSMKKEFGCSKSLHEDCAEKMKLDMAKGDLCITVLESENSASSERKKKNDFSICCDSKVASARSSVIKSLLTRKNENNECTKPTKSIFFDEDIFPRSFASVFIHFLYTDVLDLSLIPSSDITISSLSQARAIVSGKSPDIQLHQALQILQVAKFFGVEKMVQSCEDVVVKHLTCDNCVAVLQWARDGGSKYIATHAMRRIESEFSKIASTINLFELSAEEIFDVTNSQFLQVTELELLEACIKWGEHDLLRRLEEREPNVVADTCHSISRRGLRRAELSGDELKDILKPLTNNIRKDYALPPFHQTLTEAYNRGILERAPLRDDLVICKSTSEINPDVHWLKPAEKLTGPRYYKPYHDCLKKHLNILRSQCISSEVGSSINIPDEKEPTKLKFVNLFPEILNQELFEKAKFQIEDFVVHTKKDQNMKVADLPRIFHKNYALQLITKRVLTELDIAEECFECCFADKKYAENDETTDKDDIEKSSMGSSCPSIAPDILIN